MFRPKKRKRLYLPDDPQDAYVSAPEYHTSRWTKRSREFRKSHPLCENCKKKGLIVPSQVVDHIVPVALCEDFWDETNWQALCQHCNLEKGNKDKLLINSKLRAKK